MGKTEQLVVLNLPAGGDLEWGGFRLNSICSHYPSDLRSLFCTVKKKKKNQSAARKLNMSHSKDHELETPLTLLSLEPSRVGAIKAT